MFGNAWHEIGVLRAGVLNLMGGSQARPGEVGVRELTRLSSAGFAGATDFWGRDWEGAVEAPSHDLEAIVESAETGGAVSVGRG
jgi:hypothetical protein